MKRTTYALMALFVIGVSQLAFADDPGDQAKCSAKCKDTNDSCTKKAGSDPLKKASCEKDMADCTKKCSSGSDKDKDKKK